MWFTWANLLTVVRFASIGPCAAAVIAERWVWAGTLFALAVVSDLFDGPIARRFAQASSLGGLLDHATDALFVMVLLGALAYQNYVPWVLPCLVSAAFLQYMLDSRALAGPGVNLACRRLDRTAGLAVDLHQHHLHVRPRDHLVRRRQIAPDWPWAETPPQSTH